MDFSSIGSVSSYVKALKTQNKWEQKKNGSDSTGREEYGEDSKKSIQQWMEEQDKKLDSITNGSTSENANDNKLSGILTKHYSGGKLTSTEMEYLRKKSPQAYLAAKAAQEEQSRTEKALRQCRTKNEALRMKMTGTCSAAAAMKSGGSSGSAAGGQTALRSEQAMNRYVKSGEYSSLPTEAEVKKADSLIKKAATPKDAAKAEQSPEVKKVKRAKAKAKMYRSMSSGENAKLVLDTKA